MSDPDADHVRERNEWFYRGRVVRGLPFAELRRRAYQAKLQMRAQRASALPHANPALSFSVGSWVPLGPVPLASDASGNGTQDYHQVAGRATAVVIDPADSTGNTVYIGGAQSGIWKSTNAANGVANNVVWTPITGSAKNPAGQRDSFFNQSRAAATINELETRAHPLYLPISSFHKSAWSRMNSRII